jgi:hypothetical protein
MIFPIRMVSTYTPTEEEEKEIEEEFKKLDRAFGSSDRNDSFIELAVSFLVGALTGAVFGVAGNWDRPASNHVSQTASRILNTQYPAGSNCSALPVVLSMNQIQGISGVRIVPKEKERRIGERNIRVHTGKPNNRALPVGPNRRQPDRVPVGRAAPKEHRRPNGRVGEK